MPIYLFIYSVFAIFIVLKERDNNQLKITIMDAYILTKEEQRREAIILRDWALDNGYESYINVSDKVFGCSTYVYITVDGIHNWKVRFSDHGVANINRIWNECHAYSAAREIELIKEEIIERRAKSAQMIQEAKEEEILINDLKAKFEIPEGYGVTICYRTYQDAEEFFKNKEVIADSIYQKKLDKGAFYYEYLSPKTEYTIDSFSEDYLKNK